MKAHLLLGVGGTLFPAPLDEKEIFSTASNVPGQRLKNLEKHESFKAKGCATLHTLKDSVRTLEWTYWPFENPKTWAVTKDGYPCVFRPSLVKQIAELVHDKQVTPHWLSVWDTLGDTVNRFGLEIGLPKITVPDFPRCTPMHRILGFYDPTHEDVWGFEINRNYVKELTNTATSKCNGEHEEAGCYECDHWEIAQVTKMAKYPTSKLHFCDDGCGKKIEDGKHTLAAGEIMRKKCLDVDVSGSKEAANIILPPTKLNGWNFVKRGDGILMGKNDAVVDFLNENPDDKVIWCDNEANNRNHHWRNYKDRLLIVKPKDKHYGLTDKDMDKVFDFVG